MFNVAIKEEFDDLYGSDEKDIDNWQKLCRVLKIDPVPETLQGCRAVSCHLFMGHLISLFDGAVFIRDHRSSSRSTSILSTSSKGTKRRSISSGPRQSSVNIREKPGNSSQRKTRWTVGSCVHYVVIFSRHEMMATSAGDLDEPTRDDAMTSCADYNLSKSPSKLAIKL